MKIPRTRKALIIYGIFGILLIGSITTLAVYASADATITLIDSGDEGKMSSVLIKTGGMRIYIDPYNIGEEYEDQKADLILITHPHGDHYDPDTLDMLITPTTQIVCPTNCSDIITAYNATGISPGDSIIIEGIDIEAIPAYNINTANMAHLEEYGWCGYILTVGDYTIMQTGDTSLIPEYGLLRGEIDLLIIPIGWGCSNMGLEGAVQAVGIIEPRYILPIHYSTFEEEYTSFKTQMDENYPDITVDSSFIRLF